jgi:hypothetical protein
MTKINNHKCPECDKAKKDNDLNTCEVLTDSIVEITNAD